MADLRQRLRRRAGHEARVWVVALFLAALTATLAAPQISNHLSTARMETRQ